MRAKALGLLRQSLTTAEELGMAGLAGRARRLIDAFSRVTSTPLVYSRSDSLTEREIEVLRLLAGGRSNREIAAELVLSLRTVEHHIANIYAKTGACGRAAATAYALRHAISMLGETAT